MEALILVNSSNSKEVALLMKITKLPCSWCLVEAKSAKIYLGATNQCERLSGFSPHFQALGHPNKPFKLQTR